MNRQDIATLAFRITGIFVALSPIRAILGVLATLTWGFSSQMGIEEFLEGPLLMLLLTIVLEGAVAAAGILCFVKSRQLAMKTFPESTVQPEAGIRVSLNEGQELAFSVVGLWFLCVGLAEFAQVLGNVWVARQASALVPATTGLVESWVLQFLTPAIYLILGAFLFFRYKDVIALWQRWRRTGSTD